MKKLKLFLKPVLFIITFILAIVSFWLIVTSRISLKTFFKIVTLPPVIGLAIILIGKLTLLFICWKWTRKYGSQEDEEINRY